MEELYEFEFTGRTVRNGAAYRDDTDLDHYLSVTTISSNYVDAFQKAQSLIQNIEYRDFHLETIEPVKSS